MLIYLHKFFRLITIRKKDNITLHSLSGTKYYIFIEPLSDLYPFTYLSVTHDYWKSGAYYPANELISACPVHLNLTAGVIHVKLLIKIF